MDSYALKRLRQYLNLMDRMQVTLGDQKILGNHSITLDLCMVGEFPAWILKKHHTMGSWVKMIGVVFLNQPEPNILVAIHTALKRLSSDFKMITLNTFRSVECNVEVAFVFTTNDYIVQSGSPIKDWACFCSTILNQDAGYYGVTIGSFLTTSIFDFDITTTPIRVANDLDLVAVKLGDVSGIDKLDVIRHLSSGQKCKKAIPIHSSFEDLVKDLDKNGKCYAGDWTVVI